MMKSTVQPPVIRKLFTLALVTSMFIGLLSSGHTSAQLRQRTDKRVAFSYPNLQRFAVNLTRLARLGKLDAVKGYDTEIGQVVETLANSTITPVLVGESSLERASIARGLALRIASGAVPATLRDKQI